MNWKQALKQMKLEYIKRTSPAFFEASGGFETEVKPYKDHSVNTLAKCIIDFLKFKDYQVKRLSTSSINIDQFDRFNFFVKSVGVGSNSRPRNIAKLLKGAIFITAVSQNLELLIQIKSPSETCPPGTKNGFIRVNTPSASYSLNLNMSVFMQWYDHTTEKQGAELNNKQNS